jgi:hypothetical protein
MKFKRKNSHGVAQVVRIPSTEGCADYCIRCALGAAFVFLVRGLKTLETLAMHKRPRCNVAGSCKDTGLAMIGNEPPEVHNCECRLTQDLAIAVMDIQGQIDLILDDAERLSRMVERRADPPRNTTKTTK